MNIVCFASVITAVSALPGAVALHPCSETPISRSPLNAIQRMVVLLRHVQRQSHRAVPAAAEPRAVANKIARYVWSKGDLAWRAFGNLGLQIQLRDLYAVGNILGVQYQHNWLTFLQGDLGWSE